MSDMVELGEDGYAVLGSYLPDNGTNEGLTLSRVTAEGELLWVETYQDKRIMRPRAMFVDHEGIFTVLTSLSDRYNASTDVAILRMDGLGNLITNTTIEFQRNDDHWNYAEELKQADSLYSLPDGDLVVTVHAVIPGVYDNDILWVFKTDTIGQIKKMWDFWLVGGVDFSKPVAIAAVGDGYATIRTEGGIALHYESKEMDSHASKVVWDKYYYGDGSINVALAVLPLPDDRLLVVGTTDSFGAGKSDIVLFKVDRLSGRIVPWAD